MGAMERRGERTPEGAEGGATQEGRPKRPERARMLRLALGLLLLIVFVIFVVQNSTEVPIGLLWADLRAPLIVVFIGCALVGALLAYLFGRPYRRTMRKYIRELERERDGRERRDGGER
jgi:uncharacterized integral membrane protein